MIRQSVLLSITTVFFAVAVAASSSVSAQGVPGTGCRTLAGVGGGDDPDGRTADELVASAESTTAARTAWRSPPLPAAVGARVSVAR